ncbi:hypothetical protein AC481_01110 [miscellaneous Crenarchaeota group archaeon SMTZ-80]|nr:MAG: hypothetical protein AC481_01110 [miscellaneous Crenarchaeota group archaeon SMTZ-80]
MYKESKKIFQFYCSLNSKNFAGCNTSFDDAKYVILGVPYDKTSTYRPGSRFAPSHIREASLNIETYSFKTNLDLEEIKICDLGDLNIVDSLEETLKRLKIVVTEIVNADKIPIVIGGEHTITTGVFKSLKENSALMIFDAHLDFREEYMGSNFSHATFVRHLMNALGPEKIILAGTRAVSKVEVEYAKKIGLFYITTNEIQQNEANVIINKIKSKISDLKKVYISLDMDVLDPAYAPAVGNPEGFGINIKDLMEIIYGLRDIPLSGFDLVEVVPHYDQGVTAIQAAKIIFEIISLTESVAK